MHKIHGDLSNFFFYIKRLRFCIELNVLEIREVFLTYTLRKDVSDNSEIFLVEDFPFEYEKRKENNKENPGGCEAIVWPKAQGIRAALSEFLQEHSKKL